MTRSQGPKQVIKREHHLIPSAENTISRLEGEKLFTVIDLKDEFWQVPLDYESLGLCTFNTPYGRYKFNVLPFGIASAPEVFQKRDERLIGDLLYREHISRNNILNTYY